MEDNDNTKLRISERSKTFEETIKKKYKILKNIWIQKLKSNVGQAKHGSHKRSSWWRNSGVSTATLAMSAGVPDGYIMLPTIFFFNIRLALVHFHLKICSPSSTHKFAPSWRIVTTYVMLHTQPAEFRMVGYSWFANTNQPITFHHIEVPSN